MGQVPLQVKLEHVNLSFSAHCEAMPANYFEVFS
jgi:hypothetical protein